MLDNLEDNAVGSFKLATPYQPYDQHQFHNCSDSAIRSTIASKLTAQQTDELHRILLSYIGILDHSGRLLEKDTGMNYHINTGNEHRIHRFNYRVSVAEHQGSRENAR